MLFPLIALAAGLQLDAPQECGRTTFSRALALTRTSETVCVGRDPDGRAGDYLLRRVATDAHRHATTTWVRTRNCPAALTRIQELEDLAMPRPDLPGFGQEVQEITLDGAGYRLTTSALYGGTLSQIAVESNVGTPLANWIDQALTALRPCWRGNP